MKKKTIISTIIVTFVMLIVAVVSLFYLPSEIAVQWNENGISSTANKFIVLIFPALNVVFIILYNPKSKEDISKSDFINLFVALVLFAAQSIITLNALGQIDMLSLNYGLLQTVALLVVGLMICVCENHIPKFVKNYYCGVKSAFAFKDDNLWTKTQRFAGKVWFISGLIIMILSFIQWKGAAFLALGIILNAIVVPRIYSTSQYKNMTIKMNRKSE